MPSVAYEVRESQVDWLTVTTRSRPEYGALLHLGDVIRDEELKCDPTVSQWYWRGYQGTRGEHFAYGAREDTDILQLAGPLAAKWFPRAYALADKVTRIDLAVTVFYDGGREGVAHGCYNAGCQHNAQAGKGPERSLIQNSQGGSTYYVGVRTSDLFGRVYDKWRQKRQEEYRFCWRWELEIKGDIAGRTAARLAASTDRANELADIVSTYFIRRGNDADWMASRGKLRVKTERRQSSVASRLHWLDSSVRPVIRKLLPLVTEEELIEALGLDSESVRRARLSRSDELDGHSMD